MNKYKSISIQLFSYLLVTGCFVWLGNQLMAQPPAKNVLPVTQKNTVDTSDQSKLLHTIHADREGGKKFNDTSEIQYFAGNVQLRQNRTLFYCDSAVLNKHTNVMEAFGHVHINDNDSVNIYSDYLRYQSNDKKAFLKNNVKLRDPKSTLTTTQLDYDVQTHIAIYSLNGRLVTDSSVLTSVSGTYFADTRDATFSQNVVLVDPQYTIKTDTLQYNTFSKIATFTVPTLITSGPYRSMNTSNGWWDMIHKKGYFSKRPVIVDSASTLIADEIAVDDSSGFGEARGNVVFKDTVENVVVLCNNLKSNRVQSSFLATVNPVMIVKQNEDSTFIAADTLYSARYDSAELQPDNHTRINPGKAVSSKIGNVIPADSVMRPKTRLADSAALNKTNVPYKKVGKAFVWSVDSSSSNIMVRPADSIAHKPEKKGLFGIFRKKEKDTIPQQRKENISNDNSGKKTPGVIDSLKNVKVQPIDSTVTHQIKPGVDLTHDNNVSTKDSLPEEDKRSRFLEAYYNVRIYNDSMQAIGDSLYYDARDSVFQLFKNPVVWTTANSQVSQIAGDTIYMYTSNNKPKYLRVWNNAIMLSQADTLHNPKTSSYYNQMSGRTIEGWFTTGQLDSIKARGDARSVFYMLDDHNKYIGVNTQNSRVLDFYFLDKELNKIVGRSDVVGKTYPMREVNHEAIRLKGFQWLDDKRPKSKYELLAH